MILSWDCSMSVCQYHRYYILCMYNIISMVNTNTIIIWYQKNFLRDPIFAIFMLKLKLELSKHMFSHMHNTLPVTVLAANACILQVYTKPAKHYVCTHNGKIRHLHENYIPSSNLLFCGYEEIYHENPGPQWSISETWKSISMENSCTYPKIP